MGAAQHTLIGLPAAKTIDPQNGLEYYREYARIISAIVHAGGIPVLIPTDMPDAAVRAAYELVDGVLIPGGGDVDPKHYDAQLHPATQTPDASRDALELNLARWAYEDDLPLFGICRGHQVINVALGGTLIQDIPSEVNTRIKHDMPNRPDGRIAQVHEVRVVEGSRLAAILQKDLVRVNSLHHQSIEQPAPLVQVAALSPDGIVEAIEVPDKHFVVSVQWHPEDLYLDDAAMARLFASFVNAARTHARTKLPNGHKA